MNKKETKELIEKIAVLYTTTILEGLEYYEKRNLISGEISSNIKEIIHDCNKDLIFLTKEE